MNKQDLVRDAQMLRESEAWRHILDEIEKSIGGQMLTTDPTSVETLVDLAYQRQALDSLRGEINSRLLHLLETA